MSSSPTPPTFLLVSDLDGTLLHKDLGFQPDDLQMLQEIVGYGAVRVIATGRSLYSAERVLPADFPIDYLVFSSGAGILCWSSRHLLMQHSMSADEVQHCIRTLLGLGLDFMVHAPIPDNHHFAFHQVSQDNPDFTRRRHLYREFARPLTADSLSALGEACQIVCIASHDPDRHEQFTKEVQARLPQQKIIRTTSPLDQRSLWLEIFPAAVSKATAAEWLHRRLLPTEAPALALGNDFNDLDLLRWACLPFVVDTAPADLQAQFQSIPGRNGPLIRDSISLAESILQKTLV